MKKTILYLSIALVWVVSQAAFAQHACAAERIKAKNISIQRVDNILNVDFDLCVEANRFDPQLMLTVTPAIVNGADTVSFDPVLFMGGKRMKSLERQRVFDELVDQAQSNTKMRRRSDSDIVQAVSLSVPFEEWMSSGKLVLLEDACGCARWEGYHAETTPEGPLLHTPSFALSYAEVPAEGVKQRSETHNAFINFELAKHKLLPNYKNNARVLEEVDAVVTELHNDPYLTITELKVTGYASPEGVYEFNIKLSENRAATFVAYLEKKYEGRIPSDLMKVSWKGEDWDGLLRKVEESDMAAKNEVLDILREPDNAIRKRKLKQLNGGRTYAGMLASMYPVLRRSDYTVTYITKQFELHEAREVIKTRPQLLSLNEMCRVADSYPKDSREYRETMDIISSHYPNDAIVQLNEALWRVENNDCDDDVVRILQASDSPEAMNALGMVYYRRGDYTEAANSFARAARSGLPAAIRNANELERSMSNSL